jgi:hypothetical protein
VLVLESKDLVKHRCNPKPARTLLGITPKKKIAINLMTETNQPLTQYPVSVWEGIAIASSGVLLVIGALTGLGFKIIRNAFAPQRAEAIAYSLIDYQIPGGSQGAFSLNIGGAKMAVVTSTRSFNGVTGNSQPAGNSPPEVELIVAKTPIDRETTDSNSIQDFNPAFSFLGLSFSYQSDSGFQATSSRLENKPFCGVTVPVTIQAGQQTLTNQGTTVPAIKYSIRVTLENNQRLVVLTASGKNAEGNAAKVFNSLRCK